MRLVTFESPEGPAPGALLADDTVLDLGHAAALGRDGGFPTSLQALIEAGEAAWDCARRLIEAAPDEARRPGARLLAPLPRPIRLRDCSLFLDHMAAALIRMAEVASAQAPDPKAALAAALASGAYNLKPVFRDQVVYYNADHLHVIGPETEVVWPPHSTWMDYELEWACVIGPGGRDIAWPDAHRHIFGFTIFNDWSARDLQLPFMEANLGPGEGKDFANGLGPCIATPDEFDDPYALAMTATVNGEIWSRGSTASMHHRFEDAIVQFSRGKTLLAGEVLGSGTVLSGCGFELGRRLADGDVVELQVEGIGRLRNVVRRGRQEDVHGL